ncbi:MAG TPA: alpha/beta hydrolase [Mycobacteriales bacterium]
MFKASSPSALGRGLVALARRTQPTRPVRIAMLSDRADLTPADPDPDGGPWPASTVVVDGCGLRIRHTPGPTGAPPALYVHGLGGDATNFTDLAAVLAPWLDGEAVDLPGFGGSDPAPGGRYSPARQAAVLVRLIERRGRGAVHLFGNSFGGVVCLLVAAARPDLVRTLTLISPAMPTLLPPAGPARLLTLLTLPGAGRVLARRLVRLSPEQRVRAVVAACFGRDAVVPDHRLAEAIEEVRRRDSLPWVTASLVGSVRGLASVYLAGGQRSLWRQAARVTAPTLVVWGEHDRLVDVTLAPRTAAAIRRSRLLVLPGVGHAGQMEDPTTVARAFLAMVDEVAVRSRSVVADRL